VRLDRRHRGGIGAVVGDQHVALVDAGEPEELLVAELRTW
jgi:hypothetical protein